MSTEPTSNDDPKPEWLVKLCASLSESYDQDFDLWVDDKDAGWQHLAQENTEKVSLGNDVKSLEEFGRSDLSHFFEQVQSENQPSAKQLAGLQYLLAVPLSSPSGYEKYLATGLFRTDLPQLLVNMGKSILAKYQQENEIERLTEENKCFLHQVSEDFEKLTFLGFMAEHLSLADGSNSVDEILDKLLMRLGEAIETHTLCYLDCNEGLEPIIRAAWVDESVAMPRVDDQVIKNLVIEFQEDAKIQPIIKNAYNEDMRFPGVQDFVLVEVATSRSEIGWLLAVNRSPANRRLALDSTWRLSHHEFGTTEASLLTTAAAMLASHVSNLNLFQEREELLVNVVRALVSAVESKDEYTCGHSERVALYGKRLAKEVGYDTDECERLYLTGLLHDIGKIGISDAVLKKAGALTEEEFAEIKRHPDLGWSILRDLEQLNYVLPGVLHHHERVDGRGYPDQLAGDDIPQDGQLLALVDAFDAMTSDRPYRKGMPVAKAVEIFQEGAGVQWDRQLVDQFLSILPDIIEIKENYQRPPAPERKTHSKGCREVVVDTRTANCPPVCLSS